MFSAAHSLHSFHHMNNGIGHPTALANFYRTHTKKYRTL